MPGAAVSLTFDDGPEPRWTQRVAAELERCGVRGTFFLVGQRVGEARAVTSALARAGHELALHCHRHVRHSELTDSELELDTRDALAELGEIGVHRPHWRTPWGLCTPATLRTAERHRLTLVGWTLDTHDWRGDRAETMLNHVSAHLEPGAVVLMHDGLGPGALRADCEQTVALIAPLVGAARGRGLAVGPIGGASSEPRRLAGAPGGRAATCAGCAS